MQGQVEKFLHPQKAPGGSWDWLACKNSCPSSLPAEVMFHSIYCHFIPTHCDRVLDLVTTNVPYRVRVLEELSPKESDVFTDHGTVSFEFDASTKATNKIKRTVYEYRNGDFAGLREGLEALNLCNLIQDSDDINLDWT